MAIFKIHGMKAIRNKGWMLLAAAAGCGVDGYPAARKSGFYCTLIPASRMILPHFSISARITRP